MVTKLSIENFQSHENSVLDFHPGVNIIIGKSDSGKSAVLRALRWAIKNEPGGEAYRSHWGGDTLVQLQTSESDIISRKKTNATNSYSLNEQEFKAFGTKPPEAINDALRIGPTNLQAQFDSPFLLNETPGEVARYFNAVAHIDVIDRCLKTVNSGHASCRTDLKYSKGQHKEKVIELRRFELLEQFEMEVEALESFEKRQKAAILKRNTLKQHIVTLQTLSAEIQAENNVNRADNILQQLVTAGSALAAKEKRKALLVHLLSTENDYSLELQQEQTLLFCSQIIEGLFVVHTQKQKKEKQKSQISALIHTCKVHEAYLDEQEEIQAAAEGLFHTHMPEECPLCGK